MCFCTYPLLYTPRHPENFHFRALYCAVSSHENSRGSSDYQGVAESLNHPDDKPVSGNPPLRVSSRLPTGLERPPQASAKRDEGGVGFRELRRRKVGFAGRGQVYLNHGLQNRSLYCEAISENQSTPKTHAWPSRHRLTSPRSTKKSNRKFGCFWRCVGDSNP